MPSTMNEFLENALKDCKSKKKINEVADNRTTEEQSVLKFVEKQLGIYTRTNDLKTKKEIADAMKKNMAKWIKMYLAVKNK